ncbi:hypothetical protein AB0933_32235 [Streptomyces venezuelae]|uniref:hypothetical protein n=1 Tax=Streptomyces venezuelae TaxID=54571 RepID=UPI003453900C
MNQDRTSSVSTLPPIPATQPDEALDRSVAADIGPRTEGVVYYDGPRLVQVRRVITDRDQARRILKRRAAQFAVIVHDQHANTEYATCAVWTGTDRVLKAVA